MTGQLLIAGVGNIFLGDDGFGVEVSRRLAAVSLPDWVHVADYGIRGMHLAYDLADRYSSAILVDAVSRGGTPGTVYVIEPDRAGQDLGPGAEKEAQAGQAEPDGDPGQSADALAGSPLFDAHGMQPDVVLRMLAMLGAADRQVLVVGCEPARLNYGMGLSGPVAAAVDEAVRVVLDLVASAAAAKAHALVRSDPHAIVTKEWAHVPGHPR